MQRAEKENSRDDIRVGADALEGVDEQVLHVSDLGGLAAHAEHVAACWKVGGKEVREQRY